MPHLDQRKRRQCKQRHQQWLERFLPQIHAAKRPNSTYLEKPEVLVLLQHLSDGVNELLMARPLAPLPWLADYLRHACKLAYEIPNTASESLILENHRKRRAIQTALQDTEQDEMECKQTIEKVSILEQQLKLVGRERRLKRSEHVFLTSKQSSHQSNWSIDVCNLPLLHEPVEPKPLTCNTIEVQDLKHESKWISKQLSEDLQAQRCLDAYFDTVSDEIVRALVNLLLVAPGNPALWFVRYLLHPTEDNTSLVQPISSKSVATPSLLQTSYELTRKLDEIKESQRNMHVRLQAMQQLLTQLELELDSRNQFITKLSQLNVTTRTQAIMDGTPVFLNSQKHWILPGCLLIPSILSAADLQGLRRAECFLMEQEELRWKSLLRVQLEYDSATSIQSMWRGRRAYHNYQDLLKRRQRAAALIQRNYFHYLYTRAISLPRWCRPGREVLIAPSIAQKCAISFQFYPKKDFPAGNYRREREGTSIAELMEIARQDEMCAGFTTDGAFKRFLPRLLSQLKPMVPSSTSERKDKVTAESEGLYIKVFPKKDDKIVNSAIVVDVPVDKFGLVGVVLDGIAITVLVPVTKLVDRWKRIRIKRIKSKERRKTRAIVFGQGMARLFTDDSENDSCVVEPGTLDMTYERLESDEEEVEESLEKERRRQCQVHRRRQRRESNIDEDDDPKYIFEDLVTGRIMRHGRPNNTHEDPVVRARVIATRKKEYEDEKHRQLDTKRLSCAVKIQCAWRSKHARKQFRQMLALRIKERERERLVNQVGATNAHKRTSKPSKKRDAKRQTFSFKWWQR